jgi:Fe-S oxidoreductase
VRPLHRALPRRQHRQAAQPQRNHPRRARYLNDLGPASDQPLLGKYNSQEAVFQCTTCGACEFQCPVGIEHVPIIVGLRRGAVNTGAWEDDHGAKLFLAL